MDSIDLLRELTEAVGIPGNEEEVRAIITSRVAGIVNGIETDAIGNLYTWLGCESGPVIMVTAHTDEIGMIVSFIEPTGFLRIASLGRWDPRIMPGQEVVLVTSHGHRVHGVIGMPSPHITKETDRNTVIPVDQHFIDVGARSSEDVTAMGIEVGDQVVFHGAFREMHNNRLMAKALDDRAGCALLISVMERLAASNPDICLAAVFTCQEEVGLRGARVAGYRVNPSVALALEGTVAGDFPGVEPYRIPVRVGSGPSITMADNSMVAHRGLVEFIIATAREAGIPFQIKTPTFGGTDAGQLHLARGGVISGVISIPCRYIHTPRAVMCRDDFMFGIQLVTEVLSRIGRWLNTGPALNP